MLINTEEYLQHLKTELPDFNFVGMEKVEDYKNDSEIYEVSFIKEVKERKREISYRMLVGYFNFEEERQKDNFVEVARKAVSCKEKEIKEEEE